MSKRSFNKPATTITEQIEILQKRGMNIRDPNKASFYLQHINYYRLRAYWIMFESDKISHHFNVGTNFDQVIELYDFDRRLRLLLTDALERIETSIRAQWAYNMAHKHGIFSYLDEDITIDKDYYENNLAVLKKELDRSHETFIAHFEENYEQERPPIWAASEVLSLGLLSKLYTNLRPMQTRDAIAGVYNISEKLLGSWLNHLTHIRNICAHHSRLWNKLLTKIPSIIKRDHYLSTEFIHGSRQIYNTLVIILYLMDIITPNHEIRHKLKELLQNPKIPKSDMGFPQNWETRKIWNKA